MKFVHVSIIIIIIASEVFTLKNNTISYKIMELWDHRIMQCNTTNDLILLKAARYRILYVVQRTYIGHH